MYGGGKSTPAPDYTQQRADFATTEDNNRKTYADNYNANIDTFTNAMAPVLSEAKNAANNFKNFSLKDYSNFDSADSQINYYIDTLSNLKYDQPKQNFDSVVQSPYGAVSLTVPTLKSVDYSERDRILSELRNAQSKIGTYRNQYGAEEEKIRQAGASLTGALSGLSSGLSRATIADLNALNDYQSRLDSYKTEAGSYYSPIADYTDLDEKYMGKANTSIASIEARLKDLFAQRTAEEDRIKSYESGIYDRADQFDKTIGSLSIADEEKINALQREIDNYQRQTGRFSSALNFDLSQELGDLQGIEDKLSNLRSAREAELSRVNNARNSFSRMAQDLARSARTSNIYDQGTIDDLLASAGDLRNEVSGFSSKLPTDFAGVLSQLSTAETAARAIQSRRDAALNRIQSQYDNAINGVDDIPAYDEAALNDRLYRLSSLGSDIGRFSGGRADDMASAFMDGVNKIDSRIRELSTRRSQLEKQAQQLLANVKSASYTGIDQASAGITEAEKLKSEIDLYNAQQAIDEISAIMQRLTSEKSRLERDAQVVADRQSVEQNEILRSIQGLGGDTSVVGANMTAAEYLALLQKKKQEEEAAKQSAAISSFANALGIAA